MRAVAGPIAFTGGGTGGHIYPGLAVASALREAGYSGRIVWIGSKKELDRRIVENSGVEYVAIPSGKLRRSLSLENLADAFRVVAGYAAARRVLRDLRPSVLFSKGGYVSVPPCRAAAALGIPYFTHESDSSPGLATRLNATGAEKILVSWPSTARLLSPAFAAKALVVGNPVRSDIFEGNPEKGRLAVGAPEGLPIILVLGGSQGSKQVNDLVTAALPSLEGKTFIVHQTGAELHDPEKHLPIPGFYTPLPYLGAEIGDVLAASSVVAGRAGAGTIWECAALGKPMVLIPLSGSGTRGDQVENALLAAEAGAARCLLGADATPEAFSESIIRFLGDKEARERAATAGLELCMVKNPDGSPARSATYIAELLLTAATAAEGARS